MHRYVNILSVMTLLVFMLSSCSTFRSARRINMEPFSENANTLFSEATKVSRPFQWDYLKPYLYIPELQDVGREAVPLLKALQGVVYYSNQVVAINNSNLTDSEKNRQLARYLEEIRQKAVGKDELDSLHLDQSSLELIFQKIRNSKTYLKGIDAASPIINAVVIGMQNRLDGIQAKISLVTAAFDREIEKDYYLTRLNYLNLKKLQQNTMRATTLLYFVWTDHTDSLKTLLQNNPDIRQFMPGQVNPTQNQLKAAEQYLLDRLEKLDTILHQLDSEKALYHAKEQELEDWRINTDERIRIARNAIMVWAQSHRNLAAGIQVPPLIDIKGITGGLVGGAAKTGIP
jgi:hypothetical protein